MIPWRAPFTAAPTGRVGSATGAISDSTVETEQVGPRFVGVRMLDVGARPDARDSTFPRSSGGAFGGQRNVRLQRKLRRLSPESPWLNTPIPHERGAMTPPGASHERVLLGRWFKGATGFGHFRHHPHLIRRTFRIAA